MVQHRQSLYDTRNTPARIDPNGTCSGKSQPVRQLPVPRQTALTASVSVRQFKLAEHAAHGLMYDREFAPVNSHADSQSAEVEIRADYAQATTAATLPFSLTVRYRLSADGLASALPSATKAQPPCRSQTAGTPISHRRQNRRLVDGNRQQQTPGLSMPIWFSDGSMIDDTRFQTTQAWQASNWTTALSWRQQTRRPYAFRQRADPEHSPRRILSLPANLHPIDPRHHRHRKPQRRTRPFPTTA